MVSFPLFPFLGCRLLIESALNFLTLFLRSSSLANFFPDHSDAANQAIEADREARRADGAQVAADAPRTLNEQILSIEARLRPAHRILRWLQRVGAQAIAALWPDMHRGFGFAQLLLKGGVGL